MKTWYVNSNATHYEECYKYMLNQNRIVSWYNSAVKKIEKGSLILLYHNKKGFIAIGFAVSNVQKHFEFTKEEWVDVNWIWQNFDSPIAPSDVGYSGIFHTTAQAVSINHEKLIEQISKKLIKTGDKNGTD